MINQIKRDVKTCVLWKIKLSKEEEVCVVRKGWPKPGLRINHCELGPLMSSFFQETENVGEMNFSEEG